MSTPSVRRRSWRRIVILIVVALVAVLGGATSWVGWHYSSQLLDPAYARPNLPDTLLASGNGTVTLADSAAATRVGEWGLVWQGGAAVVGGVTQHTETTVTRVLLKGSAPPSGTKVRLDASVWQSDPHTAFGLNYTDVSIETELGAALGWYVPGDQATWVIAVHGRGGRLQDALRVMPALHKLGLPILDVSYRNDAGAPPSPDGYFHLGDTEWSDVQAAISYAQSRGAQHVVLYGWSMGGSIVGQLLARSHLADKVTAVVLDAPAVSWTKTLELQARDRGVPSVFTPLVTTFAHWRSGIDFDRLELADHPPSVRPPVLLFHGGADTTVPVQASRDFVAQAKRLSWPVAYVEVPGAEHTAAWNVDTAGYEHALTEFLKTTVRLTVSSR